MKRILSFFFIFCFLFYLKVECANIPFQYYEGKIIIKVQINKLDYNFILDSGASFSLISKKMQKNIKAKMTKVIFEASDANKHIQEFDIHILKSIRLNNLEINNIHFFYADIDWINQKACVEIDGIIGANVMDGKIWTIDFQSQIIIVDEEYSPIRDKHFIEISFEKETHTNVPVINGSIRNHSIDFIFDTGSGEGISIEKEIYEQVKDDNYLTSKGYQTQSINSIGIGQGILDTMEFIINGNNLGHQIIDSDIATTNMIGSRFMENHIVILDFINNKIFLYPNIKNELKIESFGFSIAPINGKLKIVHKWEIPETINIQIGDEIIKIDEFDIKNITDEIYCEIKQKMNENKNILIEKSDGNRISFKKTNLLEKM